MRHGAALLLVAVLASSSAYAQGGDVQSQLPLPGKSTPASDGKTRESSMFSKSNRSGSFFQLPALPTPSWPTLPGFSTLRNGTATTWNRTKQTTRRWWNSTVDLLSPFDNDSSITRSEKNSTGGSWFQWDGSGDQEQEIVTVNDFLKQERPKF